MKLRLNPGPNGDSNEAQRTERCEQSQTYMNENAFEPWSQRGSNEAPRQGSKTKRETVRENYDDTPAANRA